MRSIKRLSCWACVLAILAAIGNPNLAQDFQGKEPRDTLRQRIGEEPIAPFTLVDQDGKTFSSNDLLGKVWVAHFFYIACNKCNNKTSPAMSELQRLVSGRPDLVLVSISLNHDAPEDLKRYGEDWGAKPGQWLFLTGPKNVVHDIFSKTFHLGLTENSKADPGSIIEHDPKLVVVDRQGFFQGYVQGDDESAVRRLLPRMRELAASRYVLSNVNAALNFLSGVLLILGYLAIRQRRIALHKACMLSALTASTVFLGCYLYYHFAVLAGQPPTIVGSGLIRYLYLAILFSHIILAVIVAPLAVMVAYFGVRNNLTRHVRLARWTLPIWLYVSATGVVVYLILYQMYPPY